MRNESAMFKSNRRLAKRLWNSISPLASSALKTLTSEHQLSVASGDLLLLDGRWYVTHTGLLSLARRKRCAGMNVQPVQAFCDPQTQRWAFQATVYKSKVCRGFVGYGDADPSNVSFLVQGAEMRHSRCQSGSPQSLWDRHLLRRGNRFPRRTVAILSSRAQEAPSAACQRELWREHCPRSAMPVNSPESARRHFGQVLCH